MSAYRQQAPKPIEPLDVKAERAKEKRPMKPLSTLAKNRIFGSSALFTLILAANVMASACSTAHDGNIAYDHPYRALNSCALIIISGALFLANRLEGWPFRG